MGKNKTQDKAVSIIRSSAAEYLTYVAASGDSKTSVEMRYENENIWLTQKMMATLYGVTVPAINQHLKSVFDNNELQREATIKKYLIVQTEGSRQVKLAKTYAESDFDQMLKQVESLQNLEEPNE